VGTTPPDRAGRAAKIFPAFGDARGIGPDEQSRSGAADTKAHD
jgi:hypothetical protein